jgi:hypothetical protein
MASFINPLYLIDRVNKLAGEGGFIFKASKDCRYKSEPPAIKISCALRHHIGGDPVSTARPQKELT